MFARAWLGGIGNIAEIIKIINVEFIQEIKFFSQLDPVLM